MAQSPVQLDALQLEPNSGDTLTISRNSANGALHFVDAIVTNGIDLATLAGIQNAENVFVVGAGQGCSHSTIQSAVDDIDPTDTDPQTILVMPGVYEENVLIEKSVSLIGIGFPIIKAPIGPCIWIKEAVSSTPEYVNLNGIQFEPINVLDSCIKTTGSTGSDVGSTGIFIQNCNFNPNAASCYLLHASSTCRIRAVGGNWYMGDNADTASIKISDCGQVQLEHMNQLPNCQLDFDGTGAIPNWIGNVDYRIQSDVGSVQSTMTNSNPTTAILSIRNSFMSGNLTFVGDADSYCVLYNTNAQAVTCDGAQMALYGSQRTSIAGTGTITEDKAIGSEVVTATDTVTVTFDVSQPDNNYVIAVETDFVGAFGVTNKAADQFTVTFDQVQTGVLYWTLVR